MGGTDRRLYELVAPMVMNPAIIRQNNGYPFKTSSQYVWYVLTDGGSVAGFMPLKKTVRGFLLDNYYIRGDSVNTIDTLLDSILADLEKGRVFEAVVFKRHVEAFRRRRFLTAVEWKNYDKMVYNPTMRGADG